jgi:mannose-6-phosphate isomerase-like protein (cupin superfamily)
MSGWTKANLGREVDDMAPRFGYGEVGEARFARGALELESMGLSYQALRPNARQAFGHRHGEQEEIYVVVGGSGRVKLDDEVVELGTWDAVRIPVGTMRSFEGGDQGAEMLAFGAPNTENKDIEMVQDWWKD